MSEELFAQAILGHEAESFLSSDLGQYLIGCADQEANEAMAALAKVSPWRRRKIVELQNRIWRANSIQGWLAELIITGKQAHDALDNSND